ncbi:MAG: rhamnogalacturonan acetylesterase [Bacteroidales bacterium]|nr:rhamnogalacturonan acetylesterase [Bacteroidales bacterium]
MALLLSLLICLPLPSAVKVHTIGDSTMATYDDNSPKIGWGQVLQQFFIYNDVRIFNHALSGRSSKSFYQEKWSSVKRQIKEGDYVIIQFAHNDEKANGLDGDSLQAYYNKNGINKEADLRATSPNDTYKEYLRKYINETREKGGQPILVSSICRKYFSSDKKSIKRNGRHDLGDKFDKLTANGLTSGNKVSTSDHTYDYPYQMKLVAEEMGVPYLDMTTATAELFIETGETTVTTWFAANDDTHTNATGAKIMAELGARLLREAGIMTDSIVLPDDQPNALPLINAFEAETRYFDLNGRPVSPDANFQGILIDQKGQKIMLK